MFPARKQSMTKEHQHKHGRTRESATPRNAQKGSKGPWARSILNANSTRTASLDARTLPKTKNQNATKAFAKFD